MDHDNPMVTAVGASSLAWRRTIGVEQQVAVVAVAVAVVADGEYDAPPIDVGVTVDALAEFAADPGLAAGVEAVALVAADDDESNVPAPVEPLDCGGAVVATATSVLNDFPTVPCGSTA